MIIFVEEEAVKEPKAELNHPMSSDGTAETTDSRNSIDIDLLEADVVERLSEQLKARDAAQKSAKREARRQKEIEQIWTALDSGNYATQRDRVAYLLNVYPDTRESDITLTLRYWETFQSEHCPDSAIPREKLFKLERQTTISRLRAKIQNEYGLFQGSEMVQRQRRQREDQVREDVIADRAPPNVVHVFADETGKTGAYLIIGSVWFLNASRTATFQASVSALAHQLGIRGEFHFAECKRQHLPAYKEFINLAAANREFMSFKAIVTKQSGAVQVADAVIRLLRLHLLRGYEHERRSGRVAGPRRINVTLDRGDTYSALTRNELVVQLNRDLKESYGDGNTIERLAEIDSKGSASIQLADLLAGALTATAVDGGKLTPEEITRVRQIEKGEIGFNDFTEHDLGWRRTIEYRTIDNSPDEGGAFITQLTIDVPRTLTDFVGQAISPRGQLPSAEVDLWLADQVEARRKHNGIGKSPNTRGSNATVDRPLSAWRFDQDADNEAHTSVSITVPAGLRFGLSLRKVG